MDKEYDLISSNYLLQNASTSTQRCKDFLDGLNLPELTGENTKQILNQLSSSSSSSRSQAQRSVDTDHAEKRKRNNESAKRCRDARIKREHTINIKAVQLEQENSALKEKMKLLEDELRQYRLNFGQLPSGASMLSHQN